jgi:hypothetical protein
MAHHESHASNGMGMMMGMASPEDGQAQYIEPNMLLQRQHHPPEPEPEPQHSRPFTLNEALPYTPFTSVFPFEPGKYDRQPTFTTYLP